MFTTILYTFREFLGISLEDYVLADIIHQRQCVSPWVSAETIRIVGKHLGLTPLTVTTGLKRLEQYHLVEYNQSDDTQLRTTDLFNPLGYDSTPPPPIVKKGKETADEPTEESRPAPVNSARDKNNELVDLQKVISFWNHLFDSKQRLSHVKRTQMRARFKAFTKAEILESLKARSLSSWHLEPANLHHRVNFGSFWRSDEKVEYFLTKKDINAANTNGLRNFSPDEYIA